MYRSCAFQVLNLLRNIPEAPLLAIAKNSDYVEVLLNTHGPVPATVFSYLYDEYPLVTSRRLLYARPLTYDQRAVALENPSHPTLTRKAMELFFKYNVLTHEELRGIDRHLVTGGGSSTLVADLLRRHRHDEAALELILEILPIGYPVPVFDARVIPNPVATRIPRRHKWRVVAADLTEYQEGLSDGVGETAQTMYDPVELHVPVKLLSEVTGAGTDQIKKSRYYLEYKTLLPFDAAPLTELLGENPSMWLAFLGMLDAAGPYATLHEVAQTVIRARKNFTTAEMILV